MPDFRLQTEMTDTLELEEIIDSDEELSQALQAIEEANIGTVETTSTSRGPRAVNLLS